MRKNEKNSFQLNRGTLRGYHFKDVFRIFLASADAYAPQNYCVGFIFDVEQVCKKKFQSSKISNNLGIKSEVSHFGQFSIFGSIFFSKTGFRFLMRSPFCLMKDFS